MGGSVGEWMSGRLDEWDGVLSRCMCHGWIWGHGYWGTWTWDGGTEGHGREREVHAYVWMWAHRRMYTYSAEYVCSTGRGKVSGCRCTTTDTWTHGTDLHQVLLQQNRVRQAVCVCVRERMCACACVCVCLSKRQGPD